MAVMLALPIQQEPQTGLTLRGINTNCRPAAAKAERVLNRSAPSDQKRRNAVKITPQDHRGCRISRLELPSLVSGAVVYVNMTLPGRYDRLSLPFLGLPLARMREKLRKRPSYTRITIP
ncbi:hypothetical protein AB1N83_013061 [Pleurotus pulmonarius]